MFKVFEVCFDGYCISVAWVDYCLCFLLCLLVDWGCYLASILLDVFLLWTGGLVVATGAAVGFGVFTMW